MKEQDADVVQVTRQYYDSQDADNFYFLVWGGEDLHLGIYQHEKESIFHASRRTVDRMADFSDQLCAASKVLDIGAGFGGSARHLARTYGCHVTCLNLSTRENERNRRMNREQGLDDRIDVVDGSFDELPFDDEQFDIVWSQDAILHSGQRQQVLGEVSRVLKPGGEFIFTDPMKREECPDEVLGPILERIHLQDLGSPLFYQQAARDLGMEVMAVQDQTPNLVRHYTRVLEETEKKRPELAGHVSDGYLDRMRKGLQHWINGGASGYLAWGIFHFRKPGEESRAWTRNAAQRASDNNSVREIAE